MLRSSCITCVVAFACGCGAKSGLAGLVREDAAVGGTGGTLDAAVGGTGGTVDAGAGGTGGTADACAPTSELCNGLDDDCDGVADDGVACFFLGGTRIDPTPSLGCGSSWYSYDVPDPESANPSPDIRRSDQVVLAVQYAQSCNGAYIAVIADLPADGSGGQLDGNFSLVPAGSAGLAVSDEPSECAASGNVVSCNWVWQPCCTDGVLLGPFTDDSCVSINLSNASGVSGLVVLDGSDEIQLPLPQSVELCMTLVPAT